MYMLPWASFVIFIGVLLALDLGVFHKKDEEMSVQSALKWTGVWVGVSLLFSVLVYFAYKNAWMGLGLSPGSAINGPDACMKFLSGYIIEKSLSLDNIFVIAMVFAFFKVEGRYQHRVLFWGILGALILRGAMVLSGTYLIGRFSWMMYAFGGFLIITGIKMWKSDDGEFDPNSSGMIKFIRRLLPITPDFHGHQFFVRMNEQWSATPLLLVLTVVEVMDVMFAVDSIPAIFAITTDPFIVFSSNVLAILGLRSLYFALAAMMKMFTYLQDCLVVILIFVGVKMILSHHYVIPTTLSLLFIVVTLSVGVAASMILPPVAKD